MLSGEFRSYFPRKVSKKLCFLWSQKYSTRERMIEHFQLIRRRPCRHLRQGGQNFFIAPALLCTLRILKIIFFTIYHTILYYTILYYSDRPGLISVKVFSRVIVRRIVNDEIVQYSSMATTKRKLLGSNPIHVEHPLQQASGLGGLLNRTAKCLSKAIWNYTKTVRINDTPGKVK